MVPDSELAGTGLENCSVVGPWQRWDFLLPAERIQRMGGSKFPCSVQLELSGQPQMLDQQHGNAGEPDNRRMRA